MTTKQKQDAFVELQVALGFKIPMAQVARKLEIPENTVYGWYEKNVNGFRDRLDTIRERKWAEMYNAATDALQELVFENNWNAVKYVLDYYGKSAPQKVEVSGDNVIKINIVNDDARA